MIAVFSLKTEAAILYKYVFNKIIIINLMMILIAHTNQRDGRRAMNLLVTGSHCDFACNMRTGKELRELFYAENCSKTHLILEK